MSNEIDVKKPTETALLEVYKAQWDDIHHTRNQDWELSKIVLTGFAVLGGLSVFGKAVIATAMLAFGFAILSGLAILVTLRHRQLFHEKMSAIRKLEAVMRVDQLHLFTQRSEGFQPPATQTILILMYAMAAVFFLGFSVIQLIL